MMMTRFVLIVLPQRLAAGRADLQPLLRHVQDEIYDAAVVRPLLKGSYYFLFRFFDMLVIDGLLNLLAKLNVGAGKLLKRLQDGRVGTYLVFFVLGVLALLVFYMVRTAGISVR